MNRIRKIFLVILAAFLGAILILGACLKAERINLDPNFKGGISGWIFLLFPGLTGSQPYLAVAAGNGGAVLVSTDGLSWKPAATILPSTVNFNALAYTGSRFVAVGQNSATSTDAIYTSTDGENWSATSFTGCGGTSATLNDIGQGNGRIVAVGNYASTASFLCAQTSTDGGITWNRTASTSITGTFTRIAFDGTNFLVFGSASAGYRSTDGINFSAAAALPFTPVTAAYAISNTIIITGNDGNGSGISSLTTNSGSSYSATTSILQSSSQSYFPRAMAYNGTTLIAMGDSGLMDRTNNYPALNWALYSTPTLAVPAHTINWMGLTWDGSKFIAVGGAGYIASSSTGLESTWNDNLWTELSLNGIAVRH